MRFNYVSEQPVDGATRTAILADARSLRRDWWAESIVFFDDTANPGRLSGSTKVMLILYGTAGGRRVHVDPMDDMFMASRDVEFIAEQLRRWSATYALTWLVDAEGPGALGTVANGVVDDRILGFARDLADMFGSGQLPLAAADARATATSAAHRARRP